jgi:hypothetical protein
MIRLVVAMQRRAVVGQAPPIGRVTPTVGDRQPQGSSTAFLLRRAVHPRAVPQASGRKPPAGVVIDIRADARLVISGRRWAGSSRDVNGDSSRERATRTPRRKKGHSRGHTNSRGNAHSAAGGEYRIDRLGDVGWARGSFCKSTT